MGRGAPVGGRVPAGHRRCTGRAASHGGPPAGPEHGPEHGPASGTALGTAATGGHAAGTGGSAGGRTADALVIGSGPNGLTAANLLADAGWRVVVLEAAESPGGAVRSAEVTAPGFLSDLFSAFYPLAASSPVLRRLGLADFGLRWARAPVVLAHPLDGARAAVLAPGLATTAAGLAEFAAGDAAAWVQSYASWLRVGPALLAALATPFPPLRATARLAGALGGARLVHLARVGLLSAERFAAERFTGEAAALLMAGCAGHTDLGAATPGSALPAWILTMLGQQVGFPVPIGGAGMLTRALVDRLHSRGGQVRCGERVRAINVHHGRATGVTLADGREVAARVAVLADTSAPALYAQLLADVELPGRLRTDLANFDWGHGAVKVDWALAAPIPWAAAAVRRAGTVHVGGGLAELDRAFSVLARGGLPEQPFVILGQMSRADPSRCPPGAESAWAYTHVPHGTPSAAVGEVVGRLEAAVERFAPGFAARIVARHVQGPAELEAANANLVGGSISAGTAAPHQQLMFAPTPGLGRPETCVRGLYLASASAFPGPGVHGACGANAARAALAHARAPARWWTAPVVGALQTWVYSGPEAGGVLPAAANRRAEHPPST